MKLGVITDGISRDLGEAIGVMNDYGLDFAELQYIDNKEVGDLSKSEMQRTKQLLEAHDKQVSCISRHLFAGMIVGNTKPGSPLHRMHMEALKRCIGMAQDLKSPLVRIMTGKKEAILWGSHGAEKWNVAHGAWDAQLELIAPAIELARTEDMQLVVETGNGTMVNSSYTARRLIDDLDARDILRVLWDPANNCWAHEEAYPAGYSELRDGYLGHIHIKDVKVDTPRAHLEVKVMGEGQLAQHFHPIAQALRADGYDGVISLESVYRPKGGTFKDGFKECIHTFKGIFE